MALTLTLDKATYSPGDRVTLTATSTDRKQESTLSVASGAESVTATLTLVQGISLADSDTARVWTLESDDGTTTVWTATA